jgi:predicted SAM-dependent methyltransferase
MKLQLGCGQRYFEGYVNIDYPLSEHSVQQTSVADKFADLTELYYKPKSIEEVRLHHVFEHFTRATACALLTSWSSWLVDNGVLHIEVPDFQRSGKVALSRFSSEKERAVAIRHIFGSQEAHWAVHYEGYTSETLSHLLNLYGFKTDKLIKNSHLGTYNIEVIARKAEDKTMSDFYAITEKYLRNFMVVDVESERILFSTWMNEYTNQVDKTIAR